MADFLSGALRDAKQDLERKRAAGASHGLSKGAIGKTTKKRKNPTWLSNSGAKERAALDKESWKGLSESDLLRSRKALERKEREYNRMFSKGTDMGLTGDAADNLMVDFDRKWAEGHRQEDVDNDSQDWTNNDEDPEIQIQDEFGRSRTIRKSEALLFEKPIIENEAPVNLIRGPHLQKFIPDTDKKDAIWAEEKASREVHYDPNFEIRQRGTGYINLGRGDERKQRMNNLYDSRQETLHSRVYNELDERNNRAAAPARMMSPVDPDEAQRLQPNATEVPRENNILRDARRAKAGETFLNGLL